MPPDAHAHERRSRPGDPIAIVTRRDLLRASTLGAFALAIGGSSWLGCARGGVSHGTFRVLDAGTAEVLRSLAAVFVGEGSSNGAPAGFDVAAWIDTWLRDLEPATAARLRGAARVLEVSPFWLGTARTRFSAADLPARERTLDLLGASRSATLRRVGADLAELVQFASYSQPHTWPALGYDGPWVPATAGRPT